MTAQAHITSAARPRGRATARAAGRRRQGQRGMTLLEIIIALAVIGVIALVGYNGVRAVTKSNLREDATEVAAFLEAAYNLAVTSGKHHRLVFDLDQQSYRLQMCEGDIKLRHGQRAQILDDAAGGKDPAALSELVRSAGLSSSVPSGLLEAGSPAEAAKIAEALTGTRVSGDPCKAPELLTGVRDSEGYARKIRTQRGLAIRKILVQHLEGEQTDGVVAVNFFPLGYAEKAVIEVGDDEDNAYTLLVHGLTGRVEFREGEVKAEEHLMRRADGEEASER